MTELALARLLPVAPRPETDERLSSWLARIAAIYGLPVGALLAHCGLVGADPFALEKGLGAGEGALLAERTGLSPEAIEAMTFRELAAPAHGMIARGDRGICPLCAKNPAIRRRDAALPWGFWCAVHGLRRRPLGGEAIETLFGAAALTALDPLARRGARRLGDWAAGRDDATPSVPDLLAFVTAPHRRPSPPQLHEQPRLSLEARRAYRDFLEFPIARQALLAVVPEYDRIAPPLAKPVRAGLQGLADGSLLQNFALVGRSRPADPGAGRLRGGGARGRRRRGARAPARRARSLAGRAPATGPCPVSRPCGGESERPRERGGATGLRAPARLKNSGAKSHQLRSDLSQELRLGISRTLLRTGAKALSSQQFRPYDSRAAGRSALRGAVRGSNRGSGASRIGCRLLEIGGLGPSDS